MATMTRKARWHVSKYARKARCHVSTQDTLARDHINIYNTTLAWEHIFGVLGTQYSKLTLAYSKSHLIRRINV